MLLYFNLTSEITVGQVLIKNISSCTIEQSIQELSDNAEFVIPYECYLKNKKVFEYISKGADVEIKLGYNGLNETEFKGFVREVVVDKPVKIICDDEMYPLKQGNIINSWENITLKQLLNTICKGYAIDCPEVGLGKFQIDNASPYMVLQEIKNQYGLQTIVKNSTVFCGFVGDVKNRVPITHVYDFQKNVKKSDSLVYVKKEDTNIRIKAISNLANGEKITVEVGSTDKAASIRTLNFGEKTKEQLRELATQTLGTLRFDGYQGSITGFGQPRTMAGDALQLINSDEEEKNGTYFIEAVKIEFADAFFQRDNTLSYKL